MKVSASVSTDRPILSKLFHPEIYHSTPETQTDESYNHPEDIEHFAMHERIEAEEEARERRYQGLREHEVLNPPHEKKPQTQTQTQGEGSPSDEHQAIPDASGADHPHDDQKAFGVEEKLPSQPPKLPQREPPPENRPPEVKYGQAAAEGRRKDEWGQGEEGYKRPKTAADKMRKNLPYKVSTFNPRMIDL